MPIVVFGSRKGGVGKTTILCNVAVFLAHNNQSVIIVDADPLQSATDWGMSRDDREAIKPISILTVKNQGKQLLKSLRELRDKYEYVLVDLAGVGSEDNALVIGMADIVISPFRASNLDLNSLAELDDLLQKFKEIRPELRIYYVMNALRHNIPRELTDSLAYFSEFGASPCTSVLYDRKAYKETMGLGLGVLESNDEKAQCEIMSLCNELNLCNTAHIERLI